MYPSGTGVEEENLSPKAKLDPRNLDMIEYVIKRLMDKGASYREIEQERDELQKTFYGYTYLEPNWFMGTFEIMSYGLCERLKEEERKKKEEVEEIEEAVWLGEKNSTFPIWVKEETTEESEEEEPPKDYYWETRSSFWLSDDPNDFSTVEEIILFK